MHRKQSIFFLGGGVFQQKRILIHLLKKYLDIKICFGMGFELFSIKIWCSYCTLHNGTRTWTSALMLCPPTFRPLISTIQTVRRLKDTTQKHSDHVTLSPKSGWIVRPTEILTLRPQKVGCSVTVEHYIPLVFLVLTVCDTAYPISPRLSPFSPLMWALGVFSLFCTVKKFLCATWIKSFFCHFLGP